MNRERHKQKLEYLKTIGLSLQRNIVFLLSFLLLAFFILIDTAWYNMKIEYSDVKLDIHKSPMISMSMRTFNGDSCLSDESIWNNRYYYGIIMSSQWTRKGNKVELAIRNNAEGTEWLEIKGISFRFMAMEMFKIDGTNFADFLQSEQQVERGQGENIKISFVENEALLRFDTTSLISKGDLKAKILTAKVFLIILLSMIFLALCIIDIWMKDREGAEHKKWILLLSVAFVLIAIMSLWGMPYASPDENVSAGAVKYYYDHWGLPDYASEAAKDTFSNYGYSRLKEMTPYYFIAGKIGKIANAITGSAVAYRMFNLVLFFLLVVFYAVKGKNNKWLLIGLALTPQLWYLFAYTTSDAWDYCICFLISLCLIYDKQIKRRHLFSVARGILFALLFMGKANFYVMAIFAFLIYFIELVSDDKDRKNKIKEYFMVLCMTAFTYMIRMIMDYMQYGSGKQEMLAALGSPFRQVFVVSMRTRGADLLDIATETTMFESVFQSFLGNYGWMNFPSGKIYYFLFKLLYVAFVSYFMIHCYRKKDKKLMAQAISAFGMVLVALSLVYYICWAGDYQAQGRYLFGSIPCLMYLVSREKGIYEGKPYEYLMEGIALLSFVSFVKYGMMNII